MQASKYVHQVQKSAAWLKKKLRVSSSGIIVFGSNLSSAFLGKTKILQSIPFSTIPFFPQPTVKGHKPFLHHVLLGDKSFCVAEGRLHYYEGFSIPNLCFPILLYHELGIQNFIFTNVAGALDPKFQVGDLMYVSDHINFMGFNPLREIGQMYERDRFISLNELYDKNWEKHFLEIAQQQKIKLHSGVYLGLNGPSYETPAEIKAFRAWGAHAVGMSTIPEVLVAKYLACRVAAISCISNVCNDSVSTLSHEGVLEVAQQNQNKLAHLLEDFLCEIPLF
ncbi:MAG: purine-nucleoside phosphorylase [Deltaproteobacteria bacterium]|nr:purine-nucleoside phosphorylase [Deltaproteobacteria bacterium]